MILMMENMMENMMMIMIMMIDYDNEDDRDDHDDDGNTPQEIIKNHDSVTQEKQSSSEEQTVQETLNLAVKDFIL